MITNFLKKNYFFIFLMLFLLSLSVVNADERVLVNSGDWEDVYSGVLYARLQGLQYNFLTSTKHATIVANNIPGTVDNAQIFSSSANPFITSFPSLVEDQGVEEVEEIRSNNLNLDIFELLPDIEKFIVIDSTYGYNSVSVAPYAVLGDYYVLFADENNIDDVVGALDGRTVSELIIFGQTDRVVRESLDEYSPEIINSGDRFEDNMAIVDKYQNLHKSTRGEARKQAILTNGEFLEASIFTGSDPVLFIGFANVPDDVREYISQSDFEVGTLVGNELIGTATFIRRETGLSVFVKFGQGARTPTGAISQVEDLDRFAIPTYPLNLDIVSAVINTATNELEVTYQNDAPIAAYFRNILLRVVIDDSMYVIEDPVVSTFIDGNSFKTMTYNLTDVEGNPIDISGSTRYLSVSSIYGESPKSLEQTLDLEVNLEEISVLDDSLLDFVDVSYSKVRNGFVVELRNPGDVLTYAVVEAINLVVNGQTISVSSEGYASISPGKIGTVFIPVEMEAEDFDRNSNIRMRVFYGSRSDSLIRMKESSFQLKFTSFGVTFYIVIVLIVLLILAFFLNKKCPNCKHKNPIIRKTCKKCNHKL